MSEKGNNETKQKKLNLDYSSQPGLVGVEVVKGKKGQIFYDPKKFPKEIQAKFGAFALGRIASNAIIGTDGEEAEGAIEKRMTALMAGDWVTRAPAAPKVKESELIAAFNALPEDQKVVARALYEQLGIKLPA